MRYLPTWESLREKSVPQWLQEGKFGIYTHWGIYSVPACRPNASWYGHNMYKPGTPQYAHHLATYGPPQRFGYKDFIPLFTGERFDAEEWAELFRASGARFAGPVGEHHDGFAMWDSALSGWNAARMGPRRDVVAELERAIRRTDLRFMVALHHMENHYFFPHWHGDCDVADPAYAGLYGAAHDAGADDLLPFDAQQRPDAAALALWAGKTREVIDRFSPDALWFDFGLRYVREDIKREMLAYYYNEAQRKGQDVVVMYKNHDLCVGSGLIDLELGRFDRLMQNEWITDTTVDDGEGWGYLFDARYKSSRQLIHYLIDNVSKNGYLLLNVGPRPDGTIPQEAKAILADMGAWLAVNGEAIYGSTPWLYSGEGPTQMSRSGDFSEDEPLHYTSADFRYTAKGNTLYAIGLAWPEEGEVLLSRLGKELYPEEILDLRLLGAEDVPLQWSFNPACGPAGGRAGLRLRLPPKPPRGCEAAYVLRVERRAFS